MGTVYGDVVESSHVSGYSVTKHGVVRFVVEKGVCSCAARNASDLDRVWRGGGHLHRFSL